MTLRTMNQKSENVVNFSFCVVLNSMPINGVSQGSGSNLRIFTQDLSENIKGGSLMLLL